MKRLVLFLLTNIAVVFVLMVVFHIICAIIGADAEASLARDGINVTSLAVFSLVFGMGGAFISLLLSKPMARMATHAQIIDGTENETTQFLYRAVQQLAMTANVRMPQVAIYPGAPNAFATGAFKNSALIAVSDQLLDRMLRDEVKAILGHEMAHIANGDMVTLTLIQGVLNSCVIFISRIVAYLASASGRDSSRRNNSGVYFLVVYVMQFLLGIGATLIVCAYSRRREFAADEGSVRINGSSLAMIKALRRLQDERPGVLPDSLRAFGVSGSTQASLFSTHPSIADRISRLEKLFII